MKTYDETARSALKKIGQYETERKRRRKAALRVAVPAACFCLVAAIGVGAWQSGIFAQSTVCGDFDMENAMPQTEESGSGEPEEYAGPSATENASGAAEQEVYAGEPSATENASGEVVTVPEKGSDIITASGCTKGMEGTDGTAFLRWKNKLTMTGELYYAIERNPGFTYAVTASYHPVTASITSFTYEGKTLAERAIAADDERMLPEKMAQLLKEGDDLKYGAALYETGTPDGIKWDKNFYEERIAFYGDALLAKYIADGRFLRAQLEADLAALKTVAVTTPDGTTANTYTGGAAAEQYARAYNAYLETVIPAACDALTGAGIECSRDKYRPDALTMLVTEDELISLPLDDLAYWRFELAAADTK